MTAGAGDRVVRDDREIALRGQQMGRPPVDFDDAAARLATDIDPVARPVGSAEIEHDAGKHVAQRALQRQAQDDRDDAGGGEQALDRKIENIGDDREGGRDIDKARDQVLKKFAVVQVAFDPERRARQTDEEPRRPQPPGDFENRVDDVEKRHAARFERLIGDDLGVQKRCGQQDQKDHAEDRQSDRVVPEEQARCDDADREQAEHDDERVGLRQAAHRPKVRYHGSARLIDAS
jgi:hypothetical protein